ncbi:hypothetical protein MNBD_PLANCTO02-715 [hydrothermal vent metagenome]|uniref:Tyrosine specific protein phosphatases domain-containing protein n=1 Tax=hydrothermal vent metagenome TaxID=652676 RepID=A0A3B1DE01_9ZZZZ
MFQKKNWKIPAAILLIASATFWLGYRHHQKYKHLAVHQAGMMYRSAWVEPETFSELIERFQIRTVVNLCNPGEMGEERWEKQRAAVTNAGAKLMELPMPTTVNANDPLVAKHIELLNNPDNYPMLVHCQHGVTRTAKFIAIYDIIYQGKTAKESLDAQPLFGRDQHNVNITAFANDFEKKHKNLYPTASAEKLNVLKQ